MIHTVEGDGKKEFLIPSSSSDGIVLLGTSSGKPYNRAMVVFTGKEITSSSLADKAKALGLKPENELYDLLLAQLPSFKISKEVSLDRGSKKLVLSYA